MRSDPSAGAPTARQLELSPAYRSTAMGVAVLLAALVYAVYGLAPVGVIVALELWLLLAISIIDLGCRQVPNRLLGLAALLAAFASLVFRQPAPLAAVLGGGVGLAAFLLLARLRPGALGMGDVKLAGAIGLMVGFPQIVLALLAGMIAGGLVALALSLSGRGGSQRTMAYAPYLAFGAALVLLAV